MEVLLKNRVFAGGQKQVGLAVSGKMNDCFSKYNSSMTIISKNLLGQIIFLFTVEDIRKISKISKK